MICLSCRQHQPRINRASSYQIEVFGRPMPKVRPRFDSRTKNAYMPREYKEWKADVHLQAKLLKMPEFEGPVALSVALHGDSTLLQVSSLESTRPKHVTGDVDNYAGAYMDALQGIAYKNDSQVHDLRGRFQ